MTIQWRTNKQRTFRQRTKWGRTKYLEAKLGQDELGIHRYFVSLSWWLKFVFYKWKQLIFFLKQTAQKRHHFACDNYIFPKTRSNKSKQWTYYSTLSAPLHRAILVGSRTCYMFNTLLFTFPTVNYEINNKFS